MPKPYRKPLTASEQAAKEQAEISRIKIPQEPQVFGIVEQRVGGSRMLVKCFDGKTRNCRIPGRLKRRLWVREGDVIIVQPWEFDGDRRGDVLYKYTPTQVNYLRKKGYLSAVHELEDF